MSMMKEEKKMQRQEWKGVCERACERVFAYEHV